MTEIRLMVANKLKKKIREGEKKVEEGESEGKKEGERRYSYIKDETNVKAFKKLKRNYTVRHLLSRNRPLIDA